MKVDVDRILKSAIKTGRVYFGSRQAMNAARAGKAIAFILASNCLEGIRNDIEHYANLSKIPTYIHTGSSRDLALACNKPFAISAIVIRSLSEPELLRMVKESYEVVEQH